MTRTRSVFVKYFNEVAFIRGREPLCECCLHALLLSRGLFDLRLLCVHPFFKAFVWVHLNSHIFKQYNIVQNGRDDKFQAK